MKRNIVILGLVSMFTDISSEMIYPLVPLYLTMVLGASPAVLGLIEGVAESLASLLKIFSGRMADRFAQKKPLAIAGYGLSAVGKLLFVVATSWTGVFWARISDRLGKGVRTAPRDAIIADSADENERGRAFGLHRALDTAGAVIGISLAYWLFTRYQGGYVTIFWLSIIPALIGVGLLFLVKEAKVKPREGIKSFAFSWRGLDPQLKFFIAVSLLFNLGNSSNQFLLVKAGALGFATEHVILLYLLMNVVYLVAAYPAGFLSDRVGRKRLLVAGYSIYGMVYLGFAVVDSSRAIIGLFGVYGLYTGLTEGVEKALLADIAPAQQRASIFGLHALVVGISLLPASLLAGLLWDLFGAAAPFWFGGGLGMLSAAALGLGLKK